MQIASVGIDLGKNTFHLLALDERGIIKQKFSRKQLLAYTANLTSALIGIEACSGAHFIGAALREQGHDVRLISGAVRKTVSQVEADRPQFLWWPAASPPRPSYAAVA